MYAYISVYLILIKEDTYLNEEIKFDDMHTHVKDSQS